VVQLLVAFSVKVVEGVVLVIKAHLAMLLEILVVRVAVLGHI
jgi:hypothetical protein